MGPLEAKTVAEAHRCWDGLIARYPWPQSKAFAVMYCESKGNTYARNPRSSATGLMQILGGSTNPEANMAQAYGMYDKRGWQPWSCA
jgi:soluble lytic murein transglycosylase-like protein